MAEVICQGEEDFGLVLEFFTDKQGKELLDLNKRSKIQEFWVNISKLEKKMEMERMRGG